MVPADGFIGPTVKLQRITTNYAGYLQQFYQDRPELTAQPYSVQHRALMDDCYGWADFWSTALAKHGYETSEIVSNAGPMQKAWAREHKVSYDEKNWLLAITTAQVKAFRPDVLFVNDYLNYPAAYVRQLRSECPSIRLVLGWCGAPYSDASVFEEYDVVLSSVPEMVRTFRAQGHRCEHINHAFDARVLERLTKSEPDVEFSFIGTIATKSEFHKARKQLILDLLETTPLQLWIDARWHSLPVRGKVLARQLAFDAVQAASRVGVPEAMLRALPGAGKVKEWKARPSLPPRLDERIVLAARGPLFGVKMFQQLQRSRVSLNNHIDISSTHASNMRLYEATGAGSCLLTDAMSNMKELFEPDVEVVTYKNAEECAEKVNYLLAHETERQAIARAGQQRTLREHSFDNRAARLDEIIKVLLTSR